MCNTVILRFMALLFAAIISVLAIGSAGLALVSLTPGLHEGSGDGPWGPESLSLVRKSPYHVYHVSALTETRAEDCYFQADPDGLNQLLRAFSKVEVEEQPKVVVRPRDRERSGNAEFEYNALLRNPDPADRRWQGDITMLLLPPVPTLTIYVDDVKSLKALHFPENLTLIHPAEYLPKLLHEIPGGSIRGNFVLIPRRLNPDAKPAAEVWADISADIEGDESKSEHVRQWASETLELIANPSAEFQETSDAIKALLQSRRPAPSDSSRIHSHNKG